MQQSLLRRDRPSRPPHAGLVQTACGGREVTQRRRQGGGKLCVTDTKLLMRMMLYNIPGEWSYSTDLMEKEQEVCATVIGVDTRAGVREADGTLNDSWCRLGYL